MGTGAAMTLRGKWTDVSKIRSKTGTGGEKGKKASSGGPGADPLDRAS